MEWGQFVRDRQQGRWGVGGNWYVQKQCWNNGNIVELLPVKLTLLAFTKELEVKSVHFLTDNTIALRYFLKMVDTKNQKLID